MQAQTFINQTLSFIGRLSAPGRGAGPSESAMALDVLNALLESWNTEHLLVPMISNAQYALTAGHQTYSFGPGTLTGVLSLDDVRFLKIQSAGILRVGLRHDLKLIGSIDWDLIREKNVAALLPLLLYNDNQYPATVIHLWPKPGTFSGSSGGEGDLIWRTLLLKDTTVGNDIADHLTVQEDGSGTFIKAVLRKAVTSDLTVRVNKDGTPIGTITIPSATLVDQVCTLSISTVNFIKDEVLAWDVTASDGSQDLAGVASVTVEWQGEGVAPDVTASYLDLSVWLPLSAVAELSADINLPPGYHRALMLSLAAELVPVFPGMALRPEVAAALMQAKQNIQRLNLSNNLVVEDPPAPQA